MKGTVQVRNLVIGSGIPKICVPVMGATTEALMEETKRAAEKTPDLIEWRADYFEDLGEPEALKTAMDAVRKTVGEIPVIFTVRTVREGGRAEMDAETYLYCLSSAIKMGGFDLLDIEISHGDDVVCMLAAMAHERRIKVIASSHDFAQTPPKEEMVTRLCEMQELGADIAKLAVTPQNERDVLDLLDATLRMKERHQETPVITMAMGELGKLSRMCGLVFGSAVTFGCVEKSSAPGQIEIEKLRQLQQALV